MNDLRFILTVQGEDYELTHSPEGWEDMIVKDERSTKYYGVFTEYSVNIKFVKDGALILRDVYYTALQIPDPILTVKRLNKLTGAYVQIFALDVDMSTFEDFHTYVQATAVNSGLSRLIKTNETAEFILEYTSTDVIRIANDPGSRLIKYIQLSKIAELLFDKVTNGGYTDGDYDIDLTWFNKYTDLLVMITGQSIAGSGAELGQIKMSFEKFFKMVNSFTPVGIKIEVVSDIETLYFADREDLYDITIVDTLELGEKFNVKTASDYITHFIELGYETNTYDNSEANNYEFAVTAKWAIPIKHSTTIYDLKSPVRADAYGIYDVWANPDGNEEELFLVYLSPDEDPTYLMPLPGRTFSTILGDVTTFNQWLSPKRCLLRHKAWLDCMISFPKRPRYEFVSGGLNLTYLSTEVDGTDFQYEGQGFDPLEPAFGAQTIFKPVMFSIDGTVESDFFDNIKANPHGCVSFEYEGNTYTGYVQNLSYKMYGSKYVTIDLLCTFNTDLTKLIR